MSLFVPPLYCRSSEMNPRNRAVKTTKEVNPHPFPSLLALMRDQGLKEWGGRGLRLGVGDGDQTGILKFTAISSLGLQLKTPKRMVFALKKKKKDQRQEMITLKWKVSSLFNPWISLSPLLSSYEPQLTSAPCHHQLRSWMGGSGSHSLRTLGT